MLQKPDKVFLHHHNLMYALGGELTNIGPVRETFFYSQAGNSEVITSSKVADFRINDDLILEIGGKNKTTSQILGMENAYLAMDNIEHGFKNKIPLWLFGFLYSNQCRLIKGTFPSLPL